MPGKKYLLGIDLGSSSVKVSLVETASGNVTFSCFEPSSEMEISSPTSGWAEQDPSMWWTHLKAAIGRMHSEVTDAGKEIEAIGISYQMHGLVLIDAEGSVLRPSIIWCDSRAVDAGKEIGESVGTEYFEKNLLNEPGNFTAAKLAWVKNNEPEIFDRIRAFMLPGDYIAYKLTGDVTTTASGLSEGIFWDFGDWKISEKVLEACGIDKGLVPKIVPSFGLQGMLTEEIAAELGLEAHTPVTYRAGDQPNNALSLKVGEPGQVAATAGTSGVIYAVTDVPSGDPQSRVNTFLHPGELYGILLCVNGTGIANNWIRQLTSDGSLSYEEMNEQAMNTAPGAEGLLFFPFGNGAERVLQNRQPEASFDGLSFNRHNRAHMFRAVQEGIVFSLYYGFEVLKELDFAPDVIRAAKANMFLSPLFCEIFTNMTGCTLQIYDTDGARGAALAAGVGAGLYPSMQEVPLEIEKVYTPDPELGSTYASVYKRWKKNLEKKLTE